MARAFPTESVGTWFRSRLATWRARRRLAEEMEALGPAERDRVLRECGLSAHHLPALVERPADAADLLGRLMADLDIDREALRRGQPETVRDLETVCAACRAWRHCRHELNRGAADHYEAFCPNAPLLGMMRPARPS